MFDSSFYDGGASLLYRNRLAIAKLKKSGWGSLQREF